MSVQFGPLPMDFGCSVVTADNGSRFAVMTFTTPQGANSYWFPEAQWKFFLEGLKSISDELAKPGIIIPQVDLSKLKMNGN